MSAEILLCVVVAITDGDTLTVRCAQETIKTRLSEIDAPEKSQPWGQRSKEALSSMCFGKSAELRPLNTDRYGRTVARVVCDGVDVNLAQVRAGMAWAYRKYLRDPIILAAEDTARVERRGLWADSTPLPPWEWRAWVRTHKISQ